MNNNEHIADRLEEIIDQMFSSFRPFNTGATEYSIFYKPSNKGCWFIVIFFADKNQLTEGLKNGVCYQIHSYLQDQLEKISEISNIERSISFESGQRPMGKAKIDSLFEKLSNRYKSQKESTGKEDIEVCGMCGHNFDSHQLLCNLDNTSSTPTQGWIICPEENCNCFQTWSANYSPNG